PAQLIEPAQWTEPAELIAPEQSPELLRDSYFENLGYAACSGAASTCTGTSADFMANSWNSFPPVYEVRKAAWQDQIIYGLDMNEQEPYTIFQQVSGLEIGQSYELSVQVSPNSDCGPVFTQTGFMSAGQNRKRFAVTDRDEEFVDGWFTFVAGQSSMEVRVGSETPGKCGFLLSQVSLRKV
ncbi:MAG: hypothetical protein SGCHY_005222, partial [Lobulomycetales sp.]